MCESSEGSGETARMLMLVRALTDRMCHINTHFVHVREQWRLRHDYMCATSSLSIDWKNMSYVPPFLCMCESSEGFGETARMLRWVWALTDTICCLHSIWARARGVLLNVFASNHMQPPANL